jgi:hypothetical protein
MIYSHNEPNELRRLIESSFKVERADKPGSRRHQSDLISSRFLLSIAIKEFVRLGLGLIRIFNEEANQEEKKN